VTFFGPKICGEFTPVTMRSVLMVWSRSSEICAPQMTRASSSSRSVTVSTILRASSRVMFGPPEMLMSAPFAPVMSTSKRGLWMAFSTDSIARFSESDSPTPIMATPPLPITVLISAKSKLTSPVLVTSSAMPLTAFVKISSATLNAVCNGKPGQSSSSLSFGITIKVSTICSSFSRPSIAFAYLRCPSMEKGIVTMATVRIPIFFAMSAMTGVAPVPVPPPRPQVTKTMSAPWIFSFTSFSLSFAASSPIFGMLPAPRPLVSSFPIRIFASAVV